MEYIDYEYNVKIKRKTYKKQPVNRSKKINKINKTNKNS